MRKWWPISTLLLFLVLVACQAPAQGAFGTSRRAAGPALIRPISDAAFVTVGELAADPSAWAGAAVETGGVYLPQPLIVCSGIVRKSPATWFLADGDDRVPAGGFDAVLRALDQSNVELTVAGRWQRWQGPVGCGKRALPQSFWYLAVDEIIAPNPLSRGAVAAVTTPITITAEVTRTQETPPPGPGPVGTPVQPPGGAAPTATPVLPPTPFPTQPPATATPAPSPSPLPSATPTGEATETPEPPPPGSTETATPTPSNTPLPGTTPTADGTAVATPTSQATASSTPEGMPVDVGNLDPQAVGKSNFEGGDTHRWEIELDAPDQITLSVAPAVNLDVRFSIVGEDGSTLVSINDGGVGQVEKLSVYPLTDAGTYFVDVEEVNGAVGNYAILFLLSTSFEFVMQPSLSYGDTATSNLPADVDHFWNFDGEDGDVITIVVSPDAAANIFVELFSPEMEVIARRISQSGAGEVREIVNFTLPDTGFYTIRIGEFDFGPAVYTVSLTGPP